MSSIDYLCTIAKAELALIAGKGAPFDDVDSMIVYIKEQGQLPVAFMAPPPMLMMKATSRTMGADFNLIIADGGAESIKQVLGEGRFFRTSLRVCICPIWKLAT